MTFLNTIEQREFWKACFIAFCKAGSDVEEATNEADEATANFKARIQS